MRKRLLAALVVVLALAASGSLVWAASPPADAQARLGLAGTWDRLNPDQSNPTPEHEVLRCGGKAEWHCVYDKHPEPRLGFENPPDSTFGRFRGENITAGWTCPAWFPSDVCTNPSFVVGGVMDFRLSDGSEAAVNQELVVSEMDGVSVLYVYWVDEQFACPWFRSFGEALAANPFPTPFNSVDWPKMDWSFPP